MEKQKLDLTNLQIYYYYLLSILLVFIIATFQNTILSAICTLGYFLFGFVAHILLCRLSPDYRLPRNLYGISFVLALVQWVLLLTFAVPAVRAHAATAYSMTKLLGAAQSLLLLFAWLSVMRATAWLCDTYHANELGQKIGKLVTDYPKLLFGVIGCSLLSLGTMFLSPVVGLIPMLALAYFSIRLFIQFFQWIGYVRKVYVQLHGKYRKPSKT